MRLGWSSMMTRLHGAPEHHVLTVCTFRTQAPVVPQADRILVDQGELVCAGEEPAILPAGVRDHQLRSSCRMCPTPCFFAGLTIKMLHGFNRPNGAGKTTTINCLTGVLPPTGRLAKECAAHNVKMSVSLSVFCPQASRGCGVWLGVFGSRWLLTLVLRRRRRRRGRRADLRRGAIGAGRHGPHPVAYGRLPAV